MIVQTVGRIVNFWPDEQLVRMHNIVWHDTTKPLAAMIVHVNDAQLVNLVAYDSLGYAVRVQHVKLLQGEERVPGERCAEWMPYQKGQAAKTEAIEQKLESAAT